MKIKFFSVILLSILLIASCGSSSTKSSASPVTSSTANRPQWTEIPEKVDRGDAVFFIGSSNYARSEDDAIRLASQDAFAKVSNSFGVSVKSSIEDQQTSIDGSDSYRLAIKSSVTGRQIEVKNYQIKEKYTEKSGRDFNAFVLISVPKNELARIQIEVDSFGVWALKSNISEAAADKMRELFPVLNNKGIKINQKIEFSDKTPSEIFNETKKAFFLKIECNEIKAEENNDEFYSIIEIKIELFDLMTGKTINRWTAEGKGAAYSKEDAISGGITKTLNEIINQI